MDKTLSEYPSQVSGLFLSTLLAAATEAGDDEYYDSFMENQMLDYIYSGYSLPPALEDLRAGRTTVEAIFTEGWGGFEA
jgi:hypothetical protein